ncbi:hypothetical protein U1Q18_036588 [Sarracenia purpurea var. burkii]
MSRGNATYSALLLVACVSVLIGPTLAEIWGGIGLLPGAECFTSLKGIQGCVEDIISSFLGGEIREISKSCCQAFIDIDDKCWPKMFPLNPFFPPLVKNYCNAEVQA